VVGELLADERAHALLRSAVSRGDRIEATGLFVLDRQGGAKKRKNCIAGRGGKLIDEAAEVDGCHAAHLLSAFRLSDSALVGNGVIQRYRRTEEFSAAVRGFHVDCFRMGYA
jgi:hypothetical protein